MENNENSLKRAAIYIVTHPNWNGWLKIGYSTKPKQRLGQYNSSVPVKNYSMEIIFRSYLDNIKYLESAIKELFKLKYVVSGNEWFKCTPEEARTEIVKLVSEFEMELRSPDKAQLGLSFIALGKKLLAEAGRDVPTQFDSKITEFIIWMKNNYQDIGSIILQDKTIAFNFSNYYHTWNAEKNLRIDKRAFLTALLNQPWVAEYNKLKRLDGKPQRVMVLTIEVHACPQHLKELYNTLNT